MIKQTVLPFKLETTKDLITSHAGLALLGEFAIGLGLNKALDRYLSRPGRRFEIESAPGVGTTISLTVPLDGREQTKMEQSELIPGEYVPMQVGIKKLDGKIRVMLVDDHPVMRDGLSRMLNSIYDMEVVGEASDGEEAVHMARKLVPDVILMDISMPKMDGLEATRIIHAEFPHIRIIGLSMYDENDQAKAMLNAGASAYRSKSGNSDRLLAAIRAEEQ